MRLTSLLLAGLLCACAGEERSSEDATARQPLAEEWGQVDTVGVVNIAEGDTSSGYPGLTLIETTRAFGGDGEVVGWEFFARELNPVKLIIVRRADSDEYFELVGESETIIPRKRGVNRFALREPIPVGFRYMFGVVQPEEPTIPFRKVLNWQTLISTRPLERPLMRKDRFVVYGWRYSVRVFWRRSNDEQL